MEGSSSKDDTTSSNDDIFEDNIELVLNSTDNILLHGPGGCGKSTFIRRLVSELVRKVNVKVTATTGMAAVNLSLPGVFAAATFHSFIGAGLAQGNVDSCVKIISKKPLNVLAWKSIHTLVLDEVSMLSGELFYKAENIARILRKNDLFFGGIRLILSGDFLQLPPINANFVFESEVWANAKLKVIVFNHPYRYTNLEWFHTLNRIRVGTPTKNDLQLLKSRVITPPQNITKLFSRIIDVKEENERRLDELETEEIVYNAIDKITDKKGKKETYPEYEYEKFKRIFDDVIESELKLKVGAVVILRVNYDVSNGLVNGSRGVITKLGKEVIGVNIKNSEIFFERHIFSIETEYVKATRSQFPFLLGWAVTIHRSQGATLDLAQLDLGPSVFSPAQAYVALSRVRDISGVYLSAYTSSSIKFSKKSIEYVRTIEC